MDAFDRVKNQYSHIQDYQGHDKYAKYSAYPVLRVRNLKYFINTFSQIYKLPLNFPKYSTYKPSSPDLALDSL